MDSNDQFSYHVFLDKISTVSLEKVKKKDLEYGASWKKRGGSNAFAMLARKWDRIEEALTPKNDTVIAPISSILDKEIPAYDILKAGEFDLRSDGILDDIEDLKNYLLLVQAEIAYQRSKSDKSNGQV